MPMEELPETYDAVTQKGPGGTKRPASDIVSENTDAAGTVDHNKRICSDGGKDVTDHSTEGKPIDPEESNEDDADDDIGDEDMTRGDIRWSFANLPDHIIVCILSYLPLRDRHWAALACKSWSDNFDSPYLWKFFTFCFYTPSQSNYLKCLDKYGKLLQHVEIKLDQSVPSNRLNACEVIRRLGRLSERRLTHLAIRFTGENPYFYAGLEFAEALSELFGPVKEGSVLVNQLQGIDLKALPVGYEDNVFNHLSANHTNITHLNIQNRVLVCKVSHICMLRLVQRCRKLKDLRVFTCSVSEEVLLSFTEEDREPLQHLSMICRREEKYAKNLSSEVWSSVVKKLPQLRVTLAFDHTCPADKIALVMKPEIPVTELRLETFTYIYDEVRMAYAYYKALLEKMVLETAMSRNSPELNSALVELATECTKLQELHVYCILKEDTVQKILALHPDMRDRGSYTLKWYEAPAPWIAGADALPIKFN